MNDVRCIFKKLATPALALLATITPIPDEHDWFGIFRLGIWPDFFPGVQFSRDPEALNQYFRQITPDTGPLDPELNAEAITALFPFSDLNSLEIADLMSEFLKTKGLD